MSKWLRQFHGRRPVAYVWANVVVLMTVVLATVGFAVAITKRFYEPSVEDFALALGAIWATTLIAAVALWIPMRNPLTAVVRWARGEQDRETARMLLVEFQTSMPRGVVAAIVVCVVLVCPVAVVTLLAPVDRLTWGDGAVIYWTALFISVFNIQVAWLWIEVAIRPFVAEAARFAPDLNRVHARRRGLWVRLLAGLFSATMIVGAAGGVMQAEPGEATAGLLRALWVSAVMSATLAALVVGLVALYMAEPVRALIGGTRAVGEGDLSSTLVVSNFDELGELTESFNDMTADLRASQARVVAAADAARRQVERDLHDGAQQQLVLSRLKLGAAAGMVENKPAAAKAIIEELQHDLQRALAELRDLAHGLYPALLESDGLGAALADAAGRAPIATRVVADGVERFPAELEAAVYFCCLEALQNAAKHAGDGACASVSLRVSGGRLEFSVADDGAGFTRNGTPSRGLQNMRDRIGALGGTIAIDSAPGAGTRVAGTVPITSNVT